jgi:uncharacterized protein YgiM (DUF1202 family)
MSHTEYSAQFVQYSSVFLGLEEAPLAVRSLPSANSTVVSKLDNGARVRVVQETNGWLQIDQPLAGWVIASRTEPICQD